MEYSWKEAFWMFIGSIIGTFMGSCTVVTYSEVQLKDRIELLEEYCSENNNERE